MRRNTSNKARKIFFTIYNKINAFQRIFQTISGRIQQSYLQAKPNICDQQNRRGYFGANADVLTSKVV